MLNNEYVEYLKNEWRSGTLLNPFILFKPYPDSVIAEGEICKEVTNLFLECTAYRTSDNDVVREGAFDLLMSFFLYLHLEAPRSEQNLLMVCELVRAETSNNYAMKTDMERLFEMLEEKQSDHIALDYFNRYLKNVAGREKVIRSISKRLCPLFSFAPEKSIMKDENIFEHCGEDEIFEMGAALLHNANDAPEAPNSIEGLKNEVAFVVAVLYFMHEIFGETSKSMEAAFKLLKSPTYFDMRLKLKKPAPIAEKYWEICKRDVLAQEYNSGRILEIANFFSEFN